MIQASGLCKASEARRWTLAFWWGRRFPLPRGLRPASAVAGAEALLPIRILKSLDSARAGFSQTTDRAENVHGNLLWDSASVRLGVIGEDDAFQSGPLQLRICFMDRPISVTTSLREAPSWCLNHS